MATAPLYTPATGYGTKVGDWYYTQTSPGGGTWTQTPMTPTSGDVLGVSTTGGAPTPETVTQQTEDPNAALYSEIDRIYNEMMGLAGERESMLRANQPGVISDVTGQYEASKQSLGAEKMAGERTLTQAETQAGQTREDAQTAARRLYNELSQAGQQRWGGASSAGQAYGELTGREFQRTQATTQKAYQTAMSKVTDLRANLQDRYDAALFNLETQKNTALNDVRRAFDEKLAEINTLKTEAEINKSQMRLEALQALRNQVYEINLASVQTATALAQQKQQSESQVQALISELTRVNTGTGEALGTLSTQATANPTTNLAMTLGGTTAPTTMTGSINRRREDLFT